MTDFKKPMDEWKENVAVGYPKQCQNCGCAADPFFARGDYEDGDSVGPCTECGEQFGTIDVSRGQPDLDHVYRPWDHTGDSTEIDRGEYEYLKDAEEQLNEMITKGNLQRCFGHANFGDTFGPEPSDTETFRGELGIESRAQWHAAHDGSKAVEVQFSSTDASEPFFDMYIEIPIEDAAEFGRELIRFASSANVESDYAWTDEPPLEEDDG